MKTSLARSGFCPLSISLECKPCIRLDPFIHAIAAHCQRLEHLRMLAEFHLLFSFRSPLLWLRSLRLGLRWTRDPGEYLLPPTVFLAAPLLRKVALQKYEHEHRAILPWGQLTVLIVDSIAPYECARVLSLAPSLVFCRLRTYATEIRPIPPSYGTASASRYPGLTHFMPRRPYRGPYGQLHMPGTPQTTGPGGRPVAEPSRVPPRVHREIRVCPTTDAYL
ncbi:hypothetical protein B0H19DRAFT_281700 [Mycena capillaripes]|nr:hypothetical protein B0H19DRAFT_281700 [Mycena capillaripes]